MLPWKDTSREREQIRFIQLWKTGEGTFTWLGTSPGATFLLRPWAVVVRATVVGVAGRWRNSSRIGVRDMLSYQSHSPTVARPY